MFKLSSIVETVNHMFFPNVCMLCKQELESKEYVCDNCLKNRFPKANTKRKQTCEDIYLPNYVDFQDALWKFEKGSAFQDLIHAFKYQGLGKLAIELGEELGIYISQNPKFSQWSNDSLEKIKLIAVPLHRKKLRIRGYNQAEKIALGVAKSIHIEVLGEESLSRTRFTKTQTQFSHEERVKNMNKAFEVKNASKVEGHYILLVDDIFTTGSTVFACAEVLHQAGAKGIGILTLAIA